MATLLTDTRELEKGFVKKISVDKTDHNCHNIPVRHHVARVPDDEHVSNVGLSEPGGQHPGVHTSHKHRSGVGVISDPLEVLEHVPLPVCPVSHDPMQDVLNSLRNLGCHPGAVCDSSGNILYFCYKARV